MELKEGFIICDNNTKKRIIKEEKKFKNYIFLSFNELKNKIYGCCDKKSVVVLMNDYSLSYDLALEYIKYIPYVDDVCYNDMKLDSIVSAKNHLISLGLFKRDDFFMYRLRQFPLTFIEPIDNVEYKKVKEIIEKYTQVFEYKIIKNQYKNVVYSYNTITDEVLDICSKIVDLIKQGVSKDNIHILNMNSDYEYEFKRIAKNFNLPISYTSSKNISYLPISKLFLASLNECSTFTEVLDKLPKDDKYYSVIFNLIDSYNLTDMIPASCYNLAKELLKNCNVIEDIYDEMITLDEFDYYTDDDYVFYLGLNLGLAPRVYKDDGYLNDFELSKISLMRSIDKNKYEKNKLYNILTTVKNLIPSFKKSAAGISCDMANCINELKLEVIDKNINFGYSMVEDKLYLATLLSKYQKYKDFNDYLGIYDISSLKYQSFDNKYKGIKKELLDDFYERKPLKLSYSSIKTYFQCPFHYYADRVLGLDEFESNMAARLGTFSHAVLEDSYNNDFSFDESINKNMNECAVDFKDKFFFNVMKGVLSNLITFNKEHEKISSLDRVERECHITSIGDGFTFEGFIDKLLYKEINNEIYAAIIDYKTGKDIVSLDNVGDGFHLQLPSYMYLLSKYEPFKDKKINIIGIYLQKVNIIALDNTISIEEQRNKSFRLQGYSNKDRSLLALLDPNYYSSDYIQSMMTLKSGEFGRFSKIISNDEINDMIILVDDLINKASIDIHNGEFSISPKKIDGVNQSCTFCKYKDLCFVKYNDFIDLEKKEFKKEAK